MLGRDGPLDGSISLGGGDLQCTGKGLDHQDQLSRGQRCEWRLG